MKSISKIFTSILKKHSLIIEKDFLQLSDISKGKKNIFLENGIKIFIRKVIEEMKPFKLEIIYSYNCEKSELFLDTIISFQVFNNHIKEIFIFNPIKWQLFYSDNKQIYYNEKKIILEKKSNIFISSDNILFLHNFHLCYLFLGIFKEVFIFDKDLEKNNFAINLINLNPDILIQKKENGLLINLI